MINMIAHSKRNSNTSGANAGRWQREQASLWFLPAAWEDQLPQNPREVLK